MTTATAVEAPRLVLMSAEQAAEIERCVEVLIRANLNEQANAMMGVALAYKFARPVEQADGEGFRLHVLAGGRDDA